MKIDYFRQIGELLENRLAAVVNPQQQLEELATEVLKESSTGMEIDVNFMVNWIVQQRSLPQQVNFSYDFGQPPLTVYDSEYFYMEVLFWFPSRTAIHGHGFNGAFRVLAGHSLQTRYHFEPDVSPCQGLKLGSLELKDLEVLEPGMVCPIKPRDGLLHSVVHLGRPSLTLVVRSRQLPKSDQFTYFRCGLAFMHHLNKHRLVRQLDVIDVLRRTNSPRHLQELRKFFLSGNAHERFLTMDYCRRVSQTGGELQSILYSLTGEDDDFGDRMHEAVFETVRQDSMWAGLEKFSSKRQRLETAMLELLGSRDSAQRAVNDHLGAEWDSWLSKSADTYDL